MEKFAVLLVAETNEMKVLEIDQDKTMLRNCYDMIGCDTVEIPPMPYLDDPFVCVVDECGLYREQLFVNQLASLAYGINDHKQPIVGNALILKTIETEDGDELGGLTMEETEKVKKDLAKLVVDDLIRVLWGNAHA